MRNFILVISNLFLLVSCGKTNSASFKTLHTPHTLYQTMHEYRFSSSGNISRTKCTTTWDDSPLVCEQLYEEVPRSKLSEALLNLKVKQGEVATLFEMMSSPDIETVRITDFDRTPELRLAAASLDKAFLEAGRGLVPFSLTHKYVDYIETFAPTLQFRLVQNIVHGGEPDLYTYNFYLQDGVAFQTVAQIDFSRHVCRLSSVTKRISAGLWELDSENSLNTIRLTFRNSGEMLYLSCGVLNRIPDSERGHSTDSSSTLAQMRQILGKLVSSFLVTR